MYVFPFQFSITQFQGYSGMHLSLYWLLLNSFTSTNESQDRPLYKTFISILNKFHKQLKPDLNNLTKKFDNMIMLYNYTV